MGTYQIGSSFPPVDSSMTVYKTATVSGGNQPPAVSAISVSQDSPLAGHPVTLSVTASDADGTIASVRLVDAGNGATLDIATAPPYVWSVTHSTAGNRSFYAVAHDNAAATATSSTKSVTWQVLPPPPPDYLADRWVDVNGDGMLDWVADVVVNEKTPALYQNYINYGAPTYGTFNEGLLLFYDLDYTQHCSYTNLQTFLFGFVWAGWGGFGDRWTWLSNWTTPYLVDCYFTVNSIDSRLQFMTAEPGVSYQIQTKESLDSGPWINQGPPLQRNPVTGMLQKIFGDWKGVGMIPALTRIVSLGSPGDCVEISNASQLAACSNKVQKPNSQTHNGCGPAGWKGALVPNSPFWMVDFTAACNAHDVCYSTCDSDRARCDSRFHGALMMRCSVKYPVPPLPDGNHLNRPGLILCEGLARTYAAAVSTLGGEPYTSAQIQACLCCD